MNFRNFLIKHPSAWFPIVMSLSVLFIMLISFALFGIPAREPDEGTAAHLFQIWLVLEALMIAFFGVKWVPQKPKEGLLILDLQITAVIAACSPVFILQL